MKPIVMTAAFVLVATTPAFAQSSMPGMPNMPNMPGMQHPQTQPATPRHQPAHRRHPRAPAHPSTSAPDRAEHDMGAMPGMTQNGQTPPATSMPDMPGMSTEETVGNAPPPPAPTDHAADHYFDPALMRAAREEVQREHGGSIISKVMLNLGEYQWRDGEDGYRWDGEAWMGGDIHRLVIKSEGEGSVRGGVGAAEVQALYSRAITPYFDFQVGVRQDFEPRPRRTYAVLGVEGVAPYWFQVNGALFLSNQGEILGRLEGTYDLRLTQRLILQPRVETNLAAENIPEIGIGAGVSNVELGLRLRYEIRREFAPYIGVSFDRKLGDTADFARADGEDPSQTSVVFGLRAWF